MDKRSSGEWGLGEGSALFVATGGTDVDKPGLLELFDGVSPGITHSGVQTAYVFGNQSLGGALVGGKGFPAFRGIKVGIGGGVAQADTVFKNRAAGYAPDAFLH